MSKSPNLPRLNARYSLHRASDCGMSASTLPHRRSRDAGVLTSAAALITANARASESLGGVRVRNTCDTPPLLSALVLVLTFGCCYKQWH